MRVYDQKSGIARPALGGRRPVPPERSAVETEEKRKVMRRRSWKDRISDCRGSRRRDRTGRVGRGRGGWAQRTRTLLSPVVVVLEAKA